MDLATKVRIVAGILSAIFVIIIVWRRKNMASKRKHVL
jgi:hypothetical protein